MESISLESSGVTSLVSSVGFTNNSQSRATSIDYLFNINLFSSLKTIQTVSLYR